MNENDIIRMAQEAGAKFDHMTWVERDLQPVFKRFAAIVAAAEREACAKVCEDARLLPDVGPLYCAVAIRARGESK